MVRLSLSLVSGLYFLVKDMAENWNNPEYKPILPDEMLRDAEKLLSLPDLPEK
ncbi:MAG: hypothetical protein RBR32_11540 [Bacteroidales bacterium]|nr:hypothetical protein [Bacteroidales bacterium]